MHPVSDQGALTALHPPTERNSGLCLDANTMEAVAARQLPHTLALLAPLAEANGTSPGLRNQGRQLVFGDQNLSVL